MSDENKTNSSSTQPDVARRPSFTLRIIGSPRQSIPVFPSSAVRSEEKAQKWREEQLLKYQAKLAQLKSTPLQIPADPQNMDMKELYHVQMVHGYRTHTLKRIVSHTEELKKNCLQSPCLDSMSSLNQDATLLLHKERELYTKLRNVYYDRRIDSFATKSEFEEHIQHWKRWIEAHPDPDDQEFVNAMIERCNLSMKKKLL